VLKSIAERWQVPFGPEFGSRWEQANAIWDACFDFSQSPRAPGTYTGAPLQSLNCKTSLFQEFELNGKPLS
jgi:hypothetical protein